MWKIYLISVILLLNIVNCFDDGNVIDPTVCFDLPKRIIQAEKKINEQIELTEKLQSIGVAVRDGEPAAQFFTNFPLTDNSVRQSYYSDVTLRLSQYVGFDLYGDVVPSLKNFNPMLAKYTKCVQGYFNDFCRKGSTLKCDAKAPYPEINSICRNLLSPKSGASETPFNSMIYQFYQDSIQSPRKSIYSTYDLPPPRQLVNKFFDDCNPNIKLSDIVPNMGGSLFAQLITHDVSFRLGTQVPRGGNGIACCTHDNSRVLPKHMQHPACMAIQIPENDKFFGPLNMTCMTFIRTQAMVANDCTMSARKQMNLATSAVDLSIIYGHVKENTDRVRLFRGGLLKLNQNGLFLEDNEGYVFADERTDQHPVLALLHSLFMREHNRVATIISKMRPHFDDEKIFQEARRYVVAEYQNIVFNEWAPIFLGNLNTNYNNNTKHFDYATTNEFAQAAFRYFHLTIPDDLVLFDDNGRIVNSFKFSQTMNNLTLLETQYDDVARTLFYQTIDFSGCLDEVKNHLFPNEQGIGIDLISTDINRGRDHGVAPYYVYVRLCHGRVISSFLDLYPLISYENIWKLAKMYKSVFDIDLYVGSALENRDGSILPPTTMCLLKEQFQRYRNGDRYFFDHPQNPNPFKSGQLAEIRKSSFARIVCDNTDVNYVPLNSFYAFTRDSVYNPRVRCSQIPKVRVLI